MWICYQKSPTNSIMHLGYRSKIDSSELEENKFKCIQFELRRHLTFKFFNWKNANKKSRSIPVQNRMLSWISVPAVMNNLLTHCAGLIWWLASWGLLNLNVWLILNARRILGQYLDSEGEKNQRAFASEYYWYSVYSNITLYNTYAYNESNQHNYPTTIEVTM